MDKDFRSGFIFEENARQFLVNPMNCIFACYMKKLVVRKHVIRRMMT